MKLGGVDWKDPQRAEWIIGICWFALIWFLGIAGLLVPLVESKDQVFAASMAAGVAGMVWASGAEFSKAGFRGLIYVVIACVATWAIALLVLKLLE